MSGRELGLRVRFGGTGAQRRQYLLDALCSGVFVRRHGVDEKFSGQAWSGHRRRLLGSGAWGREVHWSGATRAGSGRP